MPGGMNGHGNEAKYLEEATEDGTERGEGCLSFCSEPWLLGVRERD